MTKLSPTHLLRLFVKVLELPRDGPLAGVLLHLLLLALDVTELVLCDLRLAVVQVVRLHGLVGDDKMNSEIWDIQHVEHVT